MEEFLEQVQKSVEAGILFFAQGEKLGVCGNKLFVMSPNDFLVKQGTRVLAPTKTQSKYLIDVFENSCERIDGDLYQMKKDVVFDSTYKAACFIFGGKVDGTSTIWSYDNEKVNPVKVFAALHSKFNLKSFPLLFQSEIRQLCNSAFVSFMKKLVQFDNDSFVYLIFALFDIYQDCFGLFNPFS